MRGVPFTGGKAAAHFWTLSDVCDATVGASAPACYVVGYEESEPNFFHPFSSSSRRLWPFFTIVSVVSLYVGKYVGKSTHSYSGATSKMEW